MSNWYKPRGIDREMSRALDEIHNTLRTLTQGDLDMTGRGIKNLGPGRTDRDAATLGDIKEELQDPGVARIIEGIVISQPVVGHNLLSTTHPDTVAGAPTQGHYVRGGASGQWEDSAIQLTDLPVIPSCRAYNSGNIAVATATDVALTFDSERYDTDTMHSTSANTGRITFTTAGKYHVGLNIEFAVETIGSRGTGSRSAWIRLNGTTIIGKVFHRATADGSPGTMIQVVADYNFAAADYVEFFARQTSGETLNVAASGNYSPEAWAHRFAA